jgi:hypothetical protein
VGLLFVSTQPIYAQGSPAFEKIRDISPDGKFALRISSSEPEDPDNIDSSLITAVDLVSLPSKEVLTNIGQDYEGRPPSFDLVQGFALKIDAHILWRRRNCFVMPCLSFVS